MSIYILRALPMLLRQGFAIINAKFRPLYYAKSIGVNIGKDIKIFSLHPGAFGSEPYLVTIGDGVIITSGVKFITHDGSTFIFRKKYPNLDVMGPIRIGDNTFIGAGATILPGVSIGKNCVIGAMSVVTRPVPDNCVVVGSPSKVICSTESFLNSLISKNSCTGTMDINCKRNTLMAMKPTFDNEGREWLIH